MSDLRAKNRAVQSATFPFAEFAQAVRDWIAAATERMEPNPKTDPEESLADRIANFHRDMDEDMMGGWGGVSDD